MPSLFLVDSSIYVFNAWYSLPDSLTNQHGQPNNAFLGFSDFAYRFLQLEKPRQLVFAFDESLHHSARKEIFAEYKANRAPAPEELKRQFLWCREWIDALGIAQVASDRYEADDLIGTLAHKHRGPDCNIVILTADKDLAQLIRGRDVWWSFAAGQQFGYKALTRKFGVRPEQIADQLALAGDKVDNIPGIPGIGMTIAARLLTKFGDLDNLRENVDRVGDMKFRGAHRVMNLLKEHGAVLDISARLTPVDCSVEAMQQVQTGRRKVDKNAIMDMMRRQNFSAARQEKWLQLVESIDRTV